MGAISGGFEFLSFHIDTRDIRPSKGAQAEFIRDLRMTISVEKREIGGARDALRRAEPRFAQSLTLLDRKIRGWGDAFSATTMRLVLAQLDAKIDSMFDDYLRWFGRVRHGKSATHQRRLMGVALLIDANIPSAENS